MARGSAEGDAPARVAVVGMAAPETSALLGALERAGIPGDRVGLFRPDRDEAGVGEYGGEARLFQPLRLVELAGHGRVFVTEEGPEVRETVGHLARDAWVIDMTGSLAAALRAPILGSPGAPAAPSPSSGGLVGCPHGVSWLLAELLRAVAAHSEPTRGTGVVLRPAADKGKAGLEGLREETVQLLNFTEPDRRTFPGQLSFNVLPGIEGEGASGETFEERLERETRALAQGPVALTFRAAWVPVFLGHTGFLNLMLKDGEPDETFWEEVAQSARFVTYAPSGMSPVESGEVEGLQLGRARPDGCGGGWVDWLVADAYALAAARALAWARVAE